MLVTARKDFRIVNFNLENLEYLRKNGLELPLKLVPISAHLAIVHDERIPHEFYDERWCEVCCPEELLPSPQQARLKRQEASGERTVHRGDVFTSVSYDPSKRPRPPGCKEHELPQFTSAPIQIMDISFKSHRQP